MYKKSKRQRKGERGYDKRGKETEKRSKSKIEIYRIKRRERK